MLLILKIVINDNVMKGDNVLKIEFYFVILSFICKSINFKYF